ncbi:ATP-dependent RNA helicase mtr4 [Mortierella sp. GBA30]|nr:ATP-dependent RNA helicase mtr4 [Mortierella sp. GBA30]
MFSGNTDAFDVFEESTTEDFSAYTGAESMPRAGQKRLHDQENTNGNNNNDNDEEQGQHSITTTRSASAASEPILTNDDADQEMPELPQENDLGLIGEGHQNKKQRTSLPLPAADSLEDDIELEIITPAAMTGLGDINSSNGILPRQVRNQVALPPNWDYIPLTEHVPQNPPARTYSFTLDPFQKLSTYAIERGESVLVAAHTSAGKTAVAEYAIATSLRNKQRVIYTSPIKALSNQKYRELQATFTDVGLMTGDVSVNPDASCLVMTTEILRAMLYRGSEVIREIAWVIFDEIHYMKDAERGVVWEETIILLPKNCHYVFLSATIPNAMEFAEWICSIKDQPCHVVYTDFRPTPLQHYLFPEGGEGIYLVVDEKGQFREENFRKAVRALEEAGGGGLVKKQKGAIAKILPKGQNKKDMSTDGPSDIYKIIRSILQKHCQPVIVFSFSKRECEAFALQVSDMTINDKHESAQVSQVFQAAMSSLSDSDRRLPQIARMLPLLQRGIGFHHGGLLPLLKEVVEILFQEGLVKVLFATETFSIGLNMPAKTVVFTGVQKFDGEKKRFISGGEYIQMSGRAGRRGLDDRGIVTMMLNAKMEPSVAKDMVLGTADPLNSAFHLSYNMILNMLRVEGTTPDQILEKSFFQFQIKVNIPLMQKERAQLEQERTTYVIEDEETIASYHNIRLQLASLARELHSIINQPSNIMRYLTRGRTLRVRIEDQDFGWGILVSTIHKRSKANQLNDEPGYLLIVLLHCAEDTAILTDADGFATGVKACPPGATGEFVPVPVSVSSIEFYGVPLLHVHPQTQFDPDQRKIAYKNLKQLQERFPDGMPVVDPVEDMLIQDKRFQLTVRRIEMLERILYEHPLAAIDKREFERKYGNYLKMHEFSSKIKSLDKRISDAFAVIKMNELKGRKRVLRRLGFTSNADVVDTKGGVACEIKLGDASLLLTELLFSGVFLEWSVQQTVALLSCFCFSERLQDAKPVSKPELLLPLKTMQDTAREIGRIQIECKVGRFEHEEEYVQQYLPDLMEVTYAWACGARFEDLLTMTDAFEGTIVRTLRSLEELLRQMAEAAKFLGNRELQLKFNNGAGLIKRDIVFVASLYI